MGNTNESKAWLEAFALVPSAALGPCHDSLQSVTLCSLIWMFNCNTKSARDETHALALVSNDYSSLVKSAHLLQNKGLEDLLSLPRQVC